MEFAARRDSASQVRDSRTGSCAGLWAIHHGGVRLAKIRVDRGVECGTGQDGRSDVTGSNIAEAPPELKAVQETAVLVFSVKALPEEGEQVFEVTPGEEPVEALYVAVAEGVPLVA